MSEPTEEQLKAFEEQMRRITVPDVLVQTAVTLINLGSQKLAEDGDTEQARSAIEGARALLPLLPEEVQAPVRDGLSQLQMAFVRATQEPQQGEPQQGDPQRREPQQQEPKQQEPKQQPDDAEERARARAKIWTPPGT